MGRQYFLSLGDANCCDVLCLVHEDENSCFLGKGDDKEWRVKEGPLETTITMSPTRLTAHAEDTSSRYHGVLEVVPGEGDMKAKFLLPWRAVLWGSLGALTTAPCLIESSPKQSRVNGRALSSTSPTPSSCSARR